MAEMDASKVVSSTAVVKEDDDGGPQSSQTSVSPVVNDGSSHQPSTTNSLNGANSGLTTEQRRKLVAEAEQQRTEHRRLQLIESQKRAEALREKQREERKRRIEETRQREEARQRRAQETKKEIERQYKDHMQTLLQRNRERVANSADQMRQMPSVMRNSYISKSGAGMPSSANGDRMTTSFTVAFGSSAPRSIFETGRSRAVSATRQLPQQHQRRSRPTERQASGQSNLPPLRRAASSQHFAEPTIAYASKVKGASPLDLSWKMKVAGGDDVPTKRRPVPGRSTVSRERCNSYAAPTAASINRQRVPSRDQKIAGGEGPTDLITSTTLPRRRPSVPNTTAGAGTGDRERSQTRGSLTNKSRPTGTPSIKPALTKPLKPAVTKKVSPPASTKSITESTKEVAGLTKARESSVSQSREDKGFVVDTPRTKPSESPVSMSPSTSLTGELLEDQNVEPDQPQVPVDSLTSEFDLAAAAPQPEPVIAEPSKLEETEKEAPKALPTEAFEEPERKTEIEVDKGELTDFPTAETVDNQLMEPREKKVVEKAAVEMSLRPDSLENISSEGDQSGESPEDIQEVSQKSTPHLPSGPIKASTTGSGEGGSLPEEEAAIYRAKMAEQRRLAKERLAELERREAEEERERRERREAERQAAIQAARERAIEEARLAAEARLAREAAEQEARLQAEREAQERAARERQRLEAIERERLENFRRAEEERALRKKRLDSIMSRVNRSDRSLSRGVTGSDSSHSLSGASATAPIATINAEDEARPGVHFSLGPGDHPEKSNVFQSEVSSSFGAPSQNGFSSLGSSSNGLTKSNSGTHFTSPLLQSLFSGGGVGAANRLTGVFASANTVASASSALTNNAVPSESRHSEESQQTPPTANLPMGTVGSASSN